MKNVLVIGAGQSAPYLIHYLLREAEAGDWFVTVADYDGELASQRVGEHARGVGIEFDVNDAAMRSTEIEKADVVVNLLPPSFQPLIGWDCVQHRRHMVSVSYEDAPIRDLRRDAQRAGVLLLTELGLDPGIDLMSAMQVIHAAHAAGGVIEHFESYGTGLPAPEARHTNPLGYFVTWNPRNVVMAAEQGAQYLQEGAIKIVPWHHVFLQSWHVHVEPLGELEAYPNRDSLRYLASLGLEGVRTMIRGTLRYPGWSETWQQIVKLGLPNEHVHIPDLPQRSYREVLEMFLPFGLAGATLEQRVANFLQLSPTGRIMQNLKWLGLFSDERIGVEGSTSARMLIHLLTEKLRKPPTAEDMVSLVHDLVIRYPDDGDRRERVVSTMTLRGGVDGHTAMAKSVGLPTAVAVKLLLNGDIPLTGCHLPTHEAIYKPVLRELEQEGIRFEQRRSDL